MILTTFRKHLLFS